MQENKKENEILHTKPQHCTISHYEQLSFKNDLGEAAFWLRKLIFKRVATINGISAWYEKATTVKPERLISELLDSSYDMRCERFDHYCQMLKRYRAGNLPIEFIDDDAFVVDFLFNKLKPCLPVTSHLNELQHAVRAFHRFVCKESDDMTQEEYVSGIDRFHEQIVAGFNHIQREFAAYELELEGKGERPATEASVSELKEVAVKTEASVNELKQKAELAAAASEVQLKETHEINRKVSKLARKKGAKREEVAKLQNLCHDYWEQGHGIFEARDEKTGHYTFESVYRYYHRVLGPLGVKSAGAFERHNRNYRRREQRNGL